MGPVSAAQSSSALAILQASRATSPDENYTDALSFLRSDIFSVSSKSVHDALIRTFSENTSLRAEYAKTFATTYEQLKKLAVEKLGYAAANTDEQRSVTIRNAATNALGEVILKNRDQFPPEGFAIRTEYPGGGVSWTLIPPKSGYNAQFAALERDIGITAANHAIEAQIANAMMRAQETGVEPPDPKEIRDRLSALYLARWQ